MKEHETRALPFNTLLMEKNKIRIFVSLKDDYVRHYNTNII